MKGIEQLQETIGYRFKDLSLLERALTHSTYAHEHGGEDNERMEYLGDAVLQLIVTEKQYRATSDDEGTLTKRRQGAVCEEALLQAVEKMGLQKWLRYAGSQDNVGKKTISSLYESVLAGIYLDGGIEEAKAFVKRHPTTDNPSVNYKGELQEWLQAQGNPPPVYENRSIDGGFESIARACGKAGVGRAKSKRSAEQLSAKELLAKLKMGN